MSITDAIMSGIGGLGYALDTPGALLRGGIGNLADLITGEDKQKGWRQSGRGLLERLGLVGENTDQGWVPDAGDIAGFAAETVLDPLNLIGGGLLKSAATKAGRIKAANKLSMAQRAAGHMPEEIVQHLHPSMLDEAGKPRPWYHGTQSTFDKFDLEKADPTALYGKGIYMTADPTMASEYVEKAGPYAQTQFYPKKGSEKILADAVRELEGRPPTVTDEFLAGHVAKHAGLAAERGKRGDLLELLDDFIPGGPEQHLNQQVRVFAPGNVRKHFADIRNPLNADQGVVDWGRLDKIAPDQSARLRKMNAGLGLPETHPINMNTLLTELGGDAPTWAKSHGYDSIAHEGGSVMGNRSHQVAIALDPSQIYAPYIAPALKKIPKDRQKRLAAIAAYNALKQAEGDDGAR